MHMAFPAGVGFRQKLPEIRKLQRVALVVARPAGLFRGGMVPAYGAVIPVAANAVHGCVLFRFMIIRGADIVMAVKAHGIFPALMSRGRYGFAILLINVTRVIITGGSCPNKNRAYQNRGNEIK